MLQEKIKNFLGSKNFLLAACSFIFTLSIWLRSIIDIGPDTGIYLDLAKKIARGGKYYYDFFESNFPLSFYFYVVQYKLSQISGIHQIILCEIFINSLGLLSIFWSSKILKKTTITNNKLHFNFIIIAYFLGFFIRTPSFVIGEFGTKTGLALILIYPYISYSFERKINLTKKDLIARGCLMGLIPCLKPHYLLIPLFIEIYWFLQRNPFDKSFKNFLNKLFKFILETDKITTLIVGIFYLLLMAIFTPEFFKFMVPMWSEIYDPYSNYDNFFKSTYRGLGGTILPFLFVFLIFSRLKPSRNDFVLILLYAAASAILILEGLNSYDQTSLITSLALICCLKFFIDLISSEKIIFSENRFIVGSLIILPLTDFKIFQATVFSLNGFVVTWWLILLFYPIFLFIRHALKIGLKAFCKNFWHDEIKKILLFALSCTVAFILFFLALKNLNFLGILTFNLIAIISSLFFFEKKFYTKISKEFHTFSTFIILAAISTLIFQYFDSVSRALKISQFDSEKRRISDAKSYYYKKYLGDEKDGDLLFAKHNTSRFPLINYLNRENKQKFYNYGAKFYLNKERRNDKTSQHSVGDYFVNDLEKSLKNPNIKLIFVEGNLCEIGFLESYFSDPNFKKIFFENFHFENRIILSGPVDELKKYDPKDVFNSNKNNSLAKKNFPYHKVHPSELNIFYDFEVYVRKN